MAQPGQHGVSLHAYESLPAPRDLHDTDPDSTSTLARLKRFFVPSAAPTNPGGSHRTGTSRDASPARPIAAARGLDKDASTAVPSSAHQQLKALASATQASSSSPIPPRPNESTPTSSSDPREAVSITLPNGQKYQRRLRLSGVSPSVGVTVQNSDRGALIQSASSRSIANGEHAWHGSNANAVGGGNGAASVAANSGGGGGGGGGVGIVGSPTTSEAYGGLTFANLSSIPGFPLRGDAGEDAKSAWSVSTTTHASPTVVQIFRRLQGEGLSQEYWMKDESSKACYDCETVFTVFRRKHHCRICGQIFCARCAAHLIPSARFGQQGHIRVCNLCFSKADHHARQHPSHPHGDEPLSHALPQANPYHPHRYRLGQSHRPSSIVDFPLSRSSRPSSLYQSMSYPTWERPTESILHEDEDGPSRPASPTLDDARDDARRRTDDAPDDGGSPRGRKSPISSMMEQHERQVSISRERDGPTDLDVAYSPALSNATAPFRRELAEDEDEGGASVGAGGSGTREADGDREAEEARELSDAKEGLGISMQINGTGFDFGREGGHERRNDNSTGTDRPVVVDEGSLMTLEQALEKGLTSSAVSHRRDSFKRFSRPASPSFLNSSTNSSGIRHSPSVPQYTRSTSRPSLSLHEGFRPHFRDLSLEGWDPFDLEEAAFIAAADSPPDIPLSEPALKHIRTMIHQSLVRERVPNAKAWEPVLERLLLEIADGPAPNVHAGDAMDVRTYVRVKKLPGGRPKDSEFIDGVLFTKNLMHKKMAREIDNPRIAVFTFGLEYQRVDHHYMLLEPIVAQEPEYLRALVARIAALRPHLVLVERNVSRLALEYLVERGIAAARYIKPEAIMAVSRATKATVIGSMDQLALQPKLGRCKKFRVQTFVHDEIPEGRKSFMRFEGCSRDLGCTILLRGGSMDTLAKVKKVVNMLALVVYNAKLEGYLFYDERLDLVPSPSTAFPPAGEISGAAPTSHPMQAASGENEDLTATIRLKDSKSRLISQTLAPYRSTALSSSSLVHFPPPYPLVRMADEDRHLRELREAREADETRKIIEEEAASRAQSISAGSSSTSLSSFRQPSITTVLLDAAALAQGAAAQKVLQKPEEVAKMHEVAEAEEQHADRLVVWNEYRETNQDSLDPADHQRLFILESLLFGKPDDPKKVCKPPSIAAVAYYGATDLTISQYVTGIVREFGQECTSPSCHEVMSDHSRVFVHGDCRIQISTERWQPTAPEEVALRGGIGLRTSCERCDCRGRLARMSEETCRISFHKFLELSFYPSERLVCSDENCPHDAHLDHVRYWYFGGVRIAIVMERIDLRDIVSPPRIVKVKPDTLLLLRNTEYETVLQRTKAFFDSVQGRINAFRLDCVQSQRLEECKAVLADFSSKCEADRRGVTRLLVSAYEHAQETHGTEMTEVRRALQEKVVQFEADWATFEKRVILSEQDSRRSSKRYSPDSILSLSPGRRSVSGGLPPALEVEEPDHDPSTSEPLVIDPGDCGQRDAIPEAPRAAGAQESPASRPDEHDLSVPMLSPLSLEPPVLSLDNISPQSLSPAPLSPNEGKAAITPTSALSRAPSIANVPSASAYPPNVSDASDIESDSTICADSRHPSLGVASSPFIRKQGEPEQYASPGDSDQEDPEPIARRRSGQLVSEIVQSFESGSIGKRDSRSFKPTSSPARPLLRRGHTEKPKPSKIRQPGTFPLSDGDSSYARNVGVLHLLDSPAASRPSRIPARSKSKSRKAVDSAQEAGEEPSTSSRAFLTVSPTHSRPPSRPASALGNRARSPPSSRPQSPVLTRSGQQSPTLGRSRPNSPIALRRPPLQSTGSSRSTIKGKAADREHAARVSESSDANRPTKPKPRGLGLSRPTASSANKIVGRRIASTGTGRVKQMSKQWEGFAARQALRKRARPVISTQPTVQIFKNVRDAAKEESDDEGRRSNNDSDGADDEFDNDLDGAEKDDDASDAEDRRRHERPKTTETAHEPPAERTLSSSTSDVSMADALARSFARPPTDDGDSSKPTLPHEGEHLSAQPRRTMYDFGPSDSEFTSFPSSPVLGSHSGTMPRMSEGESSGTDKSSYFRGLLNGLFLFRNGEFSQLQYPLLPTEHLFFDNPILLRDDEPSSIIAFALSSKIYAQSVEATKLSVAEPSLSAPAEAASIDATSQRKQPTIEDFLRRPDEASLRIATEDASLSASCKIFFAEHFEALRRQCGCERQFIESLSRCYKWDSSGGKSKADFMKTLDDRFIVKQLSSWEVDVLSSFLPAYFSYLADCLFRGQPTVLAKIFGIYRISFGKKYKNLDFLVMENLFYGRHLKQIFDLKGSTRNRRADQNNPVLLDENLMEMSLKSPLYVREESQNFIRQAIFNDSQFLSDLNVMDYSLVIGVDSAKQELVVGIVDFIRTYTWNKRIESWVKETTFIGGASKSGGPTIITPKQYKMRFREAIDGYLQLSPTPWLSEASFKAATCGLRTAAQQQQQQQQQHTQQLDYLPADTTKAEKA
ncbi:hypothetical protein JCM10212_004781 [Sporobolomyces blumeae]